MAGIKPETLRDVLFLLFGCLLASAFVGYSLMKFYEEFRKGVEMKSRVRIWGAFFGIAFLFILLLTVIVRLSK